MIIRRRTYYKRRCPYNYGYYMIDWRKNIIKRSNWLEINPKRLAIYTSCLQEAPPVGNFPIRLAAEDSINEYVDGNYIDIMRATATTDGLTIWVWTYKRLFKSVNGGKTWTLLATITGSTQSWSPATAFLKGDYVYLGVPGQNSSYSYYKVYRCNKNDGTMYNTNGTEVVTCSLNLPEYDANGNPTSNTIGAIFDCAVASEDEVSPNGCLIVKDHPSRTTTMQGGYSGYYFSIMIDMVNMTYSRPWYMYADNTFFITAGFYIKNNTTYGWFFQNIPYRHVEYLVTYSNGNTRTIVDLIPYYGKIDVKPLTYNPAPVTFTDITSTIEDKFYRIVNDWKKELATNGEAAHPSIAVTSRRNSYLNKLYWSFFYGNILAFTTDMSYNNITYWDKSGYETGYLGRAPISVLLHITPDGLYFNRFDGKEAQIWRISDYKFQLISFTKDILNETMEYFTNYPSGFWGIMVPTYLL